MTEIPGPRSNEWFARRGDAVPRGVAAIHPIVTARASGAIVEDVDGNRLIDFATGIAVLNVGHTAPEVVEAIAQAGGARHAHLLPRHGQRALHRARGAAERPHARRAREEDDVRELRRRGGRERREDRALPHRAKRDRDLRPRLPRAHAAGDVAHGQGHALQAGHGPLRPRDLPACRSPIPTGGSATPSTSPRKRSRTRSTRCTSTSARRTSPRSSWSRSRARAGSSCRRRASCEGIADFCAAHGIVFIADEIQSGIGRAGRWYAIEDEGVVPDIVTTAKSVGGGMPISAITGRAEIMDAVHAGGLGGTYGGNPVAAAASLAVLDKIEREDLLTRSREIGDDHHGPVPGVRDAARRRGRRARPRRDVRDRAGEPTGPRRNRSAPTSMNAIARRCLEQGVLVLTAGTYGNVVRLLPPITIDEALLADGLDVLDARDRHRHRPDPSPAAASVAGCPNRTHPTRGACATLRAPRRSTSPRCASRATTGCCGPASSSRSSGTSSRASRSTCRSSSSRGPRPRSGSRASRACVALFAGSLVGSSFIDARDRRSILMWSQVFMALAAAILLGAARCRAGPARADLRRERADRASSARSSIRPDRR